MKDAVFKINHLNFAIFSFFTRGLAYIIDETTY
jgi:hypothetical protein